MKKPKRTRQTLNKHIAAAPTRARKWELALLGGPPPTPIQSLARSAASFRTPSAHGREVAEWEAEAKARLKNVFADLFFPLLVAGNTVPFEELIQEVRDLRKKLVSPEEWVRRETEALKESPSKKEKGRRQRLALLNLQPDDLLNIQTVQAAIAKFDIHPDSPLFANDATIYDVMKELHIHFLKPGDAARWLYNGKVVRTLHIMRDGRPKIVGAPLAKHVDGLPYETNFPFARNPA